MLTAVDLGPDPLCTDTLYVYACSAVSPVWVKTATPPLNVMLSDISAAPLTYCVSW